MKTRYLFIIISLFFAFIVSSQNDNFKLKNELPEHPRILLFEGEEEKIHKLISMDTVWAGLHNDILKESNKIIVSPFLERKQIGMRLLAVSREALRRIIFLSYSYRMTKEEKYLQRAEKEMLVVASFRDWNPSHFLDVAEMTLGVSIGYDWLYQQLPVESRNIIKDAIIQKGINPSFDEKYNWFLDAKHNWNQVCNAGVTFGALAVYEENDSLYRHVINRSLQSIQHPMHEYAPNGSYPEGYAYWEYGTTFNVLFLSAIEKAYQTDFGLSAIPGFLNTSGYYQHMIGIARQSFNYSDCGEEYGSTPAMFWFANKLDKPSLLWNEKPLLNKSFSDNYLANRILPMTLIWGAINSTKQISPPKELMWTGGGITPVALMRTSWTNPNAIYVGFKGGTAGSNHSHMDAGSFVLDANGVRWAMDFGKQDYETLESKKLQIWTNNQESERWKVFRYNNYVHNTLTINGKLHNVKGYAPILSYSDAENFMFATSDLSTIFEGDVHAVQRGIAIVDQKYVLVRDEISALNGKNAVVRWTMLTDATVKIKGKNKIMLSKNGKKLRLEVISKTPVKMKIWSTQSPNDYDADNKDTYLVGFETTVFAGQTIPFTVHLLPEKVKSKKKDNRPLKEWSDKLGN